jgi:hypothetical protein
MPRKTSNTIMISFRLSNEAYDKIVRTITNPHNIRNQYHSVEAYCKEVVERHAFRHSTRKYKQKMRQGD